MFQVKNQAFFTSKVKRKKLKCRLLQFLFGALRVKGDYAGGPSKAVPVQYDCL